MTKTMPPVPPANQSHKGPGDDSKPHADKAKGKLDQPQNTKQQGQQGNTYQNTHNQGYQQDR